MDSSPRAVSAANNAIDHASDGFWLQRGRYSGIDGFVKGVYGFVMTGDMEILLAGDAHIDVFRKMGVEEFRNVPGRENLFDLISSRVGCHFIRAMVH